MSLKSQIGYKFTCDICAAKFKTEVDLDAHLFNSSCERELKKQGETMTTPLKVTPACLRAKHRQGEYKQLARNLRGKKPKKLCVRCKTNEVYVSPKGHVSVKCAGCLFDDFVELGLLDRVEPK